MLHTCPVELSEIPVDAKVLGAHEGPNVSLGSCLSVMFNLFFIGLGLKVDQHSK